ncbi:hypothetical protein DSECCO2_547930 [anaerobic digester metagenome]
MTKSPSSSVGTNSPPILVKRKNVKTKESRAASKTFLLLQQAHLITGVYDFKAIFITQSDVVFLLFRDGLRKREVATGSHVSPIIIAPSIAKQNERAIGLNILPSTPVRERIGIKTISIIICPKIADFIILVAPSKDIESIKSSLFSLLRNSKSLLLLSILSAIYSTIITAPSIIIPKSSAPRLIRFASTPKMNIIDIVNKRERGIMEVITSADLMFPRSSSTVSITINAPSIRFSTTVNVVFATSSLLSTMGFIKIPSGRFSCISATLVLTSLITSLESAFFSIITCPRIVSPFPLAVIAPNLFAWPNPTLATSFTRTGFPSILFTTIFSISSTDLT